MPERFRVKPDVVYAVKFSGINLDEIEQFVGSRPVYVGDLRMWEVKLGGRKPKTIRCVPGDWIAEDALGSFLPYRDAKFEELFEPI